MVRTHPLHSKIDPSAPDDRSPGETLAAIAASSLHTYALKLPRKMIHHD
jgi:hypothetical protein